MLALDVLKESQRLAERSKCAFDAGLSVWLGRSALRLEESPDRLRDILGDRQDIVRYVSLLLQHLERFAKRFASVPRVLRP